MKPLSYVGITGFKEDYEVKIVAEQYLKKGFLGPNEGFTPKNHKPMFGFVCSANRLANKSEQGKQSPRAEDLGCLTKYTPKGIISMIHYYTPNRRNLAREVKEVFSIDEIYEKNYCRSIQINMLWPEIDQIGLIRRDFPKMDVVLQLPKTALEETNRVKEYGDLVQYCLIDPSEGKGQEITNEHLSLVEKLNEDMPNTRLGVAGGLNGKNAEKIIERVYKIIGEPFCIDAQSRLRTENKCNLDLNKTENYVTAVAHAIRLGEKFY